MRDGDVTSELWTVEFLHQRPAVWTLFSGSKPLIQATGSLSVTKAGMRIKIVFLSAQGYQKELSEESIDTAEIDEAGIFHFH
jgi:hypothetical protein